MPESESRSDGLFVHEIGGGPPIVLLHSFLCSGEMWQHQAPLLAGRCRVLNVDLPGHGRSEPLDRAIDLYDLARRVVGALDALGVSRAIWCGLSIGGMIALRAALIEPERVAGLLLLDSDAGAETPYRKTKYRLMGLGARLLGIGPLLPLVARQMFGRTSRRENPRLVGEWKARFRGVHLPSMLLLVKTLVERDSIERQLSRISAPAAVIVGEEDESLPPRRSERIHRGLKDSRYVPIPGAGHLSALERPDEVNAALLEALDRFSRVEASS